MLNAQQIVQEGLLKLENTKGKPAQVGYDLSLKAVNKVGYAPSRDPVTFAWIEGRIGKVLKDRTELANYTPISITSLDGVEGWLLYTGTYDIVFNEGCKIPENRVGLIRQRSSLLRNGTVLHSSVFDPGFETDEMGTVMVVTESIFIEKDARVAQMYFHECTPAEKYAGQWAFDKQRK